MPGSRVISILFLQTVFQTTYIAGICALGTVADLAIQVISLLTTAAAEEQVVVLFVVCGGSISIPDGKGRSFDPDNDG
jgi:hypothetical protein